LPPPTLCFSLHLVPCTCKAPVVTREYLSHPKLLEGDVARGLAIKCMWRAGFFVSGLIPVSSTSSRPAGFVSWLLHNFFTRRKVLPFASAHLDPRLGGRLLLDPLACFPLPIPPLLKMKFVAAPPIVLRSPQIFSFDLFYPKARESWLGCSNFSFHPFPMFCCV